MVPDDKKDALASTTMSNIMRFCNGGMNDYHSFLLLQKFMKTALFVRGILRNDADDAIQV